MLTDYSVLISESYDGQHKLLTEELKRKGTKVHICGDTEKEIHRIITSTGINRKHSGYDYIYYMIFLIIFKYSGNKVQIGELYKDIEKQYGKSTAAIERSTRSAIVSGWEKMKPVDKQMLFESCLANGTKPTNAMYINTIALYIKHLYNDQLEMYYKNKNDHT